MKNITEALNNGELYIWVDNGGIARIPGMKSGTQAENNKMLPPEVRDIKEIIWEYLYTEQIASTIATYQGDYGILFQWDFTERYLKRFGFTISSAIKYLYTAAIDSEKWTMFGEVFIGVGTLSDGGHQVFWFAPQDRLPVRRYEYPAPRVAFENSIGIFEEVSDLDEWLASYEKETGFHLLEK